MGDGWDMSHPTFNNCLASFFNYNDYFEVTGLIQIGNCSIGLLLMRPTENYFDAHYAHLHIIIDSFFFLKSSEKKLSMKYPRDRY